MYSHVLRNRKGDTSMKIAIQGGSACALRRVVIPVHVRCGQNGSATVYRSFISALTFKDFEELAEQVRNARQVVSDGPTRT
jgi:hypothetical protein